MQIPYKLKNGWDSVGSKADDQILSLLKPHERPLVVSDGSMTLALELLLGARVSIELKRSDQTELDPEGAEYLQEKAGGLALAREVWLVADRKRLVFARSIMPIERIDKGILRHIEGHPAEPIGRVLADKNAYFSKQGLEIAIVNCPSVAFDLSIDQDTGFLARRYMLSSKDKKGSWLIKAAMTEIFSPELVRV
jgi:chorismate-pyruvate lyase